MATSLSSLVLLLSSVTCALALQILESNIVKVELSADLPTQPGCYVTVPTGCPQRKEGEAHKLFLAHVKYVLDAKPGSDASLEACKGRRKDYNKQCGVEDAEMNFVDKEGNGVQAHFFEEKLGCFVNLPAGCPNDNTTAKDTWFEDTKSGAGVSKANCKDRRPEWNTHCGVQNAKVHFAGTSADALDEEQEALAEKAESSRGPLGWLRDVAGAATKWFKGSPDLQLAVSKDGLFSGVPGANWAELAERDHAECPAIFVFVMSSRVNVNRREAIRAMWADADQGWGQLKAKFTVCLRQPHEGEDMAVGKALKEEIKQHDDIIAIDCEEGYTEGRLTKKLLAAMHKFTQVTTGEYKLFMKTDDDTFIDTARLCDFLSTQKQAATDFESAYMGVFAEGNENMYKYAIPCRDPNSSWYEPVDIFPESKYPPSAKGGPGYILSRTMVKTLLTQNIAAENILNNEDKAVGVWVDKLKSRGHDISYVNLPGTDGYEEFHDDIVTHGHFKNYPYAVHHHLEGKVINCMYRLAAKMDDTADVNACFKYHTATLSARRPTAHLGKHAKTMALFSHNADTGC